jgi:ribonuclease P protein component
LIGRIHERRAFQRLGRQGQRARTEHLWCRYLPDAAIVPPRVAFAIGRAVGPAVVRNRLRRRLRALLDGRVAAGSLTPGWLLVGASPTACELTYDELGAEVRALLARLEIGS